MIPFIFHWTTMSYCIQSLICVGLDMGQSSFSNSELSSWSKETRLFAWWHLHFAYIYIYFILFTSFYLVFPCFLPMCFPGFSHSLVNSMDLHQATSNARPRSKVGIVGTTGCGKRGAQREVWKTGEKSGGKNGTEEWRLNMIEFLFPHPKSID